MKNYRMFVVSLAVLCCASNVNAGFGYGVGPGGNVGVGYNNYNYASFSSSRHNSGNNQKSEVEPILLDVCPIHSWRYCYTPACREFNALNVSISWFAKHNSIDPTIAMGIVQRISTSKPIPKCLDNHEISDDEIKLVRDHWTQYKKKYNVDVSKLKAEEQLENLHVLILLLFCSIVFSMIILRRFF